MTELIIENDVEKKKLDGLLIFLKSWGIEAKVRQISQKYKDINKSKALPEGQLSDNLFDEMSDMLSFSDTDDNFREITMRIPSFVNLENIQRIIDLMVYKKATARSQATQDEVDRIAKEAKKDWWLVNKERFIK
jgi:hypothetical protein